MTESGTVTLHGEFGKMHQSGERPNNFTTVPQVNNKQSVRTFSCCDNVPPGVSQKWKPVNR